MVMDTTITDSLTAAACREMLAFLAALHTAPVSVESVPAANDNADQAPDSIRSIEAASIPAAPVRSDARRLSMKERTALIRKVLKTAGVRGASVTMARGSMCYWTEVRIEGIKHTDPDYDSARRCPVCARNQAADDKVTAIILAALPDLGDRSDSQRDHFDFMFTVSVRN